MSEFGRGYATCLRQFLNHRKRLAGDVKNMERYKDIPDAGPRLASEGFGVEMWANGSSDHLYGLVKPKRGVPNAEWQSAKALAERMLDIGHGYRNESASDVAEVTALLDTAAARLADLAARGHAVDTLDEAMETDRALGLRPDRGEGSCALDLDTRPWVVEAQRENTP